MEPIRPENVQETKNSTIPEAIIIATNELIIKNFNGNSASIKTKEIINLAIKKDHFLTEKEIYENKWMDIEPLFKNYGWKVEFDQPGFNETYESYFTFKKPK